VSTRRTKGGVNLWKIRRGPDGKPRCRGCGGPIGKGKRTWCADPNCLHEWKLRRDPGYVRECVFERDSGVCARCGLDCVAEYHRLKLLERTDPAAYAAEVKARKVPTHRTSLWDAEHTLAVKDGGGECGLDNITTMCVFCHKEKTAAERAARKGAK
jgi:hypothetical protein